jgi:crotonobetainyl-CoA:carnitine CoA-transferase CaiB-like acyl-CoA transferase
VTGNKSDNYERRAPGTAGMRDGVRYQIYESSDGHVLFMASEQEFWRTSAGASAARLFEANPGRQVRRPRRGQRRAARSWWRSSSPAPPEWVDWSGSSINTPSPR